MYTAKVGVFEQNNVFFRQPDCQLSQYHRGRVSKSWPFGRDQGYWSAHTQFILKGVELCFHFFRNICFHKNILERKSPPTFELFISIWHLLHRNTRTSSLRYHQRERRCAFSSRDKAMVFQRFQQQRLGRSRCPLAATAHGSPADRRATRVRR